MRNLDNDYHSWRQDRYKKFSDEFNNWRSTRSGGQGQGGSGAGSSGSLGASGLGSTGTSSTGSTTTSGVSTAPEGSTGSSTSKHK
jgi:hypothetical protein